MNLYYFWGGWGGGRIVVYDPGIFLVVKIIGKRPILWMFLSEGNKTEDGLDDSLYHRSNHHLGEYILKLFPSLTPIQVCHTLCSSDAWHSSVCFHPDIFGKMTRCDLRKIPSQRKVSNGSWSHHRIFLLVLGEWKWNPVDDCQILRICREYWRFANCSLQCGILP